MKKRMVSIIIYLTLLALPISTLWAGEAYTLPENPLKGRELLITKGCLGCHPILGEGGKIGPDLGKRGFNLSLLQVIGVLWNHVPTMAEKMSERKILWPHFTVSEMSDLVSFLYYMDYYFSYLGEPGNPSRGERVFAEKRCVACHAFQGTGGDIAPPLDQVRKYVSPIFIVQAMWNHGPEMSEMMETLHIPAPQFQANEMTDLIAYLRTVGTTDVQERVYLPPGNPRAGEQLFSQKGCNNCHAVGKEREKIGPNLSEKEYRRSLPQIAGIMWNHGPQMWQRVREMKLEWPTFTANEMADLITYLYFLRYLDQPGDRLAGQRLFQEKGCVECHALQGTGGKIGPDLALSPVTSSSLELATAMWNHAPIMEKILMEREKEWPRFRDNEMRDLVEYIRSFPQQAIADQGKKSFFRFCASCHGAEGKGDGPAAEGLKVKPPDLRTTRSKDDAYLFQVIKEGGEAVGLSPAMLAWGEALSDQQIKEVIAYIRTLGP